MDETQFDLLNLKLDRLQDHLGVLDTKEDLLLKMLDQVQQTLEQPSVVEPRFPKWSLWMMGTFFGVSVVSGALIIFSILTP